MKRFSLEWAVRSLALTLLLSCSSVPDEKATDIQVRSDKKIASDRFEIEFVFVEGSCFEMGCIDGDETCDQNAKPAHSVCVDSYWMAATEVTNRQFQEFVKAYKKDKTKNRRANIEIESEGKISSSPTIPLRRKDIHEIPLDLLDHPATNVSWFAAKALANWLSTRSGFAVRLPTEAEWEHACRSGRQTNLFGTQDGQWSYDIANYTSNDNYYNWIKTFPVGSFPSNHFGLFDLSGNVWEWCEDWYDDFFYAASSEKSPIQNQNGEYRVVRGGAYDSVAQGLRCTTRNRRWPDMKSSDVGIRLVISPTNTVEDYNVAGTSLIIRVKP